MARFIVVPYTMLSRARWPGVFRMPYHRKPLHVRDTMFGSRYPAGSLLPVTYHRPSRARTLPSRSVTSLTCSARQNRKYRNSPPPPPRMVVTSP